MSTDPQIPSTTAAASTDATPAAIALNRFGLGARPDEPIPSDAKVWLTNQILAYDKRPAAIAALSGTTQIVADLGPRTRQVRDADDVAAKQKLQMAVRRETRALYHNAVEARVREAALTDHPFAERLVHFWANHFALSADKAIVVPFVGSFETEAIRPFVMGRFEDMLLAVERHPAMILYLDQQRSVGPDSKQAERRAAKQGKRDIGLNENLAREIMELHTLGVRSGYTQADVTEFARTLTGWSINPEGPNASPEATPGGFIFRANLHEPGARTILAKRYTQAGEEQAHAVLHDLATSPATAAHIATKLARHFVSDDPPPSLVDKLTQTFTNTGGDLPSVYRALIDAPESWNPHPQKFKTPFEWLVSLLRGTGRKSFPKLQAMPLLNQLGQPLWAPGSPAGWDDVATSWAAPDALLRRVEAAQRLAPAFPNKLDPRTLAPQLLARAASEGTQMAIDGADTRETALTLLLVSPEFQRR